MKPIAVAVLLFFAPGSSLASAADANESCRDTFDQTAECLAPDEVLTEVASDDPGADVFEVWNPATDTTPLQLFFLGTGGALGGAALMSTAALFSSERRLEELLSSGQFREDLHSPYLQGTRFLAATTGFFWGAAALTSVAGLSIWVFNPKDGSVNLGRSNSHE
jgi:hypothetical protein